MGKAEAEIPEVLPEIAPFEEIAEEDDIMNEDEVEEQLEELVRNQEETDPDGQPLESN